MGMGRLRAAGGPCGTGRVRRRPRLDDQRDGERAGVCRGCPDRLRLALHAPYGAPPWPRPGGPQRLRPQLNALQGAGLVSYQHGGLPGQVWARLSDAGRDALLRDSYVPPAARPGDLGYAAPGTWAEWAWPDWVPPKVREQVEAFWADGYGCGPRAWLHDISDRGVPPFGAVVTLGNGFGVNPPPATGRYVHAWNNIGRLVLDDGSVVCTSFNPAGN
jgi:hypothetical protein